MARMTNFRSAAIATGNVINDSAYDNVKRVSDNMEAVINATAHRSSVIYGETPPTNNINPINGTNALYEDTVTKVLYLCTDATKDANIWEVTGVNIMQGPSVPTSTTEPVSGIQTIYLDTTTNTVWVCKTHSVGANVWVKNGGGQLLGEAKDKAIMWTSQTTDENLILEDGINGLIVDSLTVEDTGSVEIQGNAVLVTV